VAFFLPGCWWVSKNATLNRLRGFLLLCLPVLIAAQAWDARTVRGFAHDQLGKPAGRTGAAGHCFGAGLFFTLLDRVN